MAGKKPEIAGDSSTPEPRALAIRRCPRARAESARHPQRGIGAQRRGITVFIVQAAQHHMHALETFAEFSNRRAVAHREIRAFDQREAQVAREKNMLEISFVVGSGR